MESSEFLLSLLGPAAYALPYLLVCGVGLALCLLRRQRLGAAATYGAAGFGLLMVESLLGLANHAWMIWSLHAGGDSSGISLRSSIFGGVNMLVTLTGLSLLMTAVLMRRPGQTA